MGTLAFEGRTYKNGNVLSGQDYGGSDAIRQSGGDGDHDFVMEIRVKLPVAVTGFAIKLGIETNNADFAFRWSFQTSQNEAYYHCGYSDATLAAVSYDGSMTLKDQTSYTITVSKELDAGTYYVYVFSSKNMGYYELTTFSVANSGVTYTEAPTMSGFVKVSGSYLDLVDGFANVSGTWKELVDVFYNSGGTWKNIVTESVKNDVYTTSATIPISNTYRYLSTKGLWTLASAYQVGNLNYVGQGTADYNSMMIPVPAFSFKGTPVGLSVKLNLYVSSSSNHTFRWAITTSRFSEYQYVSYGDVSDPDQLAAGKFTPQYYSDAARHWQTFEFPCSKIPNNTPLYIYLWRDNTTYGNIHVESAAVITLEYTN